MKLKKIIISILIVASIIPIIIAGVLQNAISLQSMEQVIFFIVIFLVLLGILIGFTNFIINLLFLKPLDNLLNTIKIVQGENYAEFPFVNCNDEFSKIVSSFNVFMDKINIKTKNLYKNEQRYEIVLKLTSDLVFEADLVNDKITFLYDGWIKQFNLDVPKSYDVAVKILTNKYVCDEDKSIYYETFRLDKIKEYFSNKKEEVSLEFRRYDKDNKLIWVLTTIALIEKENDHVMSVIGYEKNIDEKKRKELDILLKSQHDSLTNLYNKATTQELIDKYITKEGNDYISAIMIVDIDNFKAINDSLGHLFGDAVLRDTSKKLCNIFRTSDIVGRIGGDEFLIFMKNVKTTEIVLTKANAVMDIFRCNFTGQNKDYKISGSIGIALYPDDGITYIELFKKADIALYHAKFLGKDQYCIYNKEIISNYIKNSEHKNLHDEVGSNVSNEQNNQSIIEYIFNVLYDTKDIHKAVDMILELIGKYFNVSRVYIFESSEDESKFSNTFEWCNDGIPSEKINLQDISINVLENYIKYFDAEGILYFDDVSKLPIWLRDFLEEQNIKSMIQCSIVEEKKIKGFVGFDDCIKVHLVTDSEKKILLMIAKIIGTFLLKKKTHDKLLESYDGLKSVMDNLNTWTYVIDPKSYELLFTNKKTADLDPRPLVGQLCFKTLYNRHTPCSVCPMTKLNENQKSCTLEMYSSLYNGWTEATASYIKWVNQKTVCIICCSDITRYKTE